MSALLLGWVLACGGAAPPAGEPASERPAPVEEPAPDPAGDPAALSLGETPSYETRQAELSTAPPDEVTPRLPPGLVVEVVYEPGAVLQERIRDLALAARLDGRLPVVELWGGWCGNCNRLHAEMAHPAMLQAFEGVRVIRVDTVAWRESMVTMDLGPADKFSLPSFYVVGQSGELGASITGHAWGANTAENMAPPLGTFFRQQRGR